MSMPLWYWTVLAGAFGLLFGSFLNAVIWRIPNRMTLMTRSECPSCGHQIRGRDNIPVLSWLLLRGKCRDCGARISARYPAIELTDTVGWLTIALVFLPTQPALVPLLLAAFSITLALFMIDLDTMRLPNVLTYPLFILAAGYLVTVAALSGDWDRLMSAVVGGAAMFGFYFLLWFGSGGRALGFGDVKLAPSLGLILGWFSFGSVIVGTAAAFILGGIPAAILMAAGVIKRGTMVPFGPMLIGGAWFAVFLGEPVAAWYLGITGLS
jgi:leader peptidase (prepilin peptidase)/N-methyltransferase